jgi:hypothetical protein
VTGAGEARLFKLCGFVAVAAGLALASAPLASWKAEQILTGLDHLGVHAGVLVVGGLLLWCAGALRRGQVSLAQRGGELQDDSLLLEQMATDLVQMRNAIDHMQLISATVQDELRAVHVRVRTAAEQPPPPPPEDGAGDAIFRLAASLDQLGARIEQRLNVQYATLQDSLEELGVTLVAARTNMQEMVGGEPAEAAHQEPQHARGYAAPAPQQAPRQAPRPAQHAQVAEEPRSDDQAGSPLGLLDQLDDEGVAAPLPRHAPRHAHQPEDEPETIQLDAPLPHTHGHQHGGGRSWEEELQMVAPQASQAQELDTRTKLHQLGELLSDERLRQALDQMRRQQ